MVCQSEEMQTCPLRHSVWPTTAIPKNPSSSRDQTLPTAENGSSQQNMLPSSTSSRHHVTATRQRQENPYSPFPCTTLPNGSSSSSERTSAVSRNGVCSRIAKPPPLPPQHQQQQQRQQQRISLPLPLPPYSGSVEGCRGTVPSAGDAGTRFPLSLQQLPPQSSRPQSLAEPSPSSQTQIASLRAQQSWRSAESLDRDSSSPMPSPGPGGCHSSPCSPTFQSGSPSQNYLYLYKHLPPVSSETDFERLGRSMHGLCEGCFYYSDLDSDGARTMLQNAPEGTFLVRDSSDPKFLFSLTVKTARGATSVRIQYYRGFFQLDCEDQMKRKLPRFETMLDLLDFHIAMCQDKQGSQYRWLESSKKKDMVVRLTNPRRHSPPSLSHLARVTVNRTLEDLHLPSRSTDLLPLPTSMKSYLRAYPYKV